MTTTTRAARPGICDLKRLAVRAEPFPHVVHDQFVAPEYYEQLCRSFPTCPASTGPTGFSLYWGDEGYERLLAEHPAWLALFDTFHSQSFVDWCKTQFAEVWQADGCRVNLAQARYVPYREDRVDKERATLRRIEHEPHELWVRMDIHQGRVGYDRRVHLDHARRLVSMLLYMCDPAENGMAGGELFLHPGGPKRPADRPLIRITPRHNLMVAFPCTNRSYHSVSRIASTVAPRNYLQVHLSSSVDVWPRTERSGALRRTLSRVKRALVHRPGG
jgi:hypothetical protein